MFGIVVSGDPLVHDQAFLDDVLLKLEQISTELIVGENHTLSAQKRNFLYKYRFPMQPTLTCEVFITKDFCLNEVQKYRTSYRLRFMLREYLRKQYIADWILGNSKRNFSIYVSFCGDFTHRTLEY